jgi:hypothetical protein
MPGNRVFPVWVFQNALDIMLTMADPVIPGPFMLSFPSGHCAQGLWLAPHHTSLQALDLAALNHPRPTLVIIGGAGFMADDSLQRLRVLFDDVLAPLAQEYHLTVIDGGTDAGVMRLMGQARHRLGGTFPLVGVLPQGQAKLPKPLAESCLLPPEVSAATDGPCHDLEPNHTHFFLTPGQDWGSESPWISELATTVATPKPALTLLINGGKIAALDLHINLAAGRPMLVLAGSGRLADEVAAALAGLDAGRDTDIPYSLQAVIQRYHPSGALLSLDINRPTAELHHQLRAYFANPDNPSAPA